MIEYIAWSLIALGVGGLLTMKRKGSGIILSSNSCWIGAHYDREKRELFIFPLPFVGLVVKL